jgi:alkanesulfonate monooxygenase SsuD/methylene tetrahydromethanopterin reductase-like flavin-dependent oxidoreductase (luciferase family)
MPTEYADFSTRLAAVRARVNAACAAVGRNPAEVEILPVTKTHPPSAAEAVARGCAQVVLATHSFQAPGFYERMGYERQYTIQGRPKGYADIIYAKVLQA